MLWETLLSTVSIPNYKNTSRRTFSKILKKYAEEVRTQNLAINIITCYSSVVTTEMVG